MKKGTHPKYFERGEVTCACGSVFFVGSTREKMAVEICSHCHPFFSGQGKILDIAGRVEKFERRRAQSAARRPAAKRPVRKKTAAG